MKMKIVLNFLSHHLLKKPKSPWGEWETDKEKEQRLEEEKEEDQEFERQLNIQLKRRIRDNRDKNYSTDSFGSGKRRKSISEKVQFQVQFKKYCA